MWIFGLCIALLISVALLITLKPLLKAKQSAALSALQQALDTGIIDQQEFKAKQQQLTSTSTHNKKPPKLFGLLLLISIPATTLLLYSELGTPDALDPELRAAPKTVADSIQQLRQTLASQPDNIEGWLLLANALNEQQRFSEAIPAYEKALALIPSTRPERAVIMADTAEAIIYDSNSQKIPDQARQYLQQAISIDPQSPRVLWLLGVISFQDQNYPLAIQHWQTLLPLVESDSVRQSVLTQVAQAESFLSNTPTPPTLVDPADPNISITAKVTLSEELTSSLQGQQNPPLLFVFVRTEGGGPPVAIQRLQLPSLPVTIKLTDANAMLPTNTLSSLSPDTPVQVVARISFSGNAIAQPGDWQGQINTQLNESNGVFPLVIDTIIDN